MTGSLIRREAVELAPIRFVKPNPRVQSAVFDMLKSCIDVFETSQSDEGQAFLDRYADIAPPFLALGRCIKTGKK